MANENFNNAIREILKHEGGYVNHPKDPGGATNFGITQAVLSAWRGRPVSENDVKNLKVEEAVLIYKKNYWDKLKCDDLPSGVDYAVADFGVNSGISRSARYLQGILGVSVDGNIGPKTIEAAKKANSKDVINKLMDQRLNFLKGLNTWSTFGKGWSRRVDGVRAYALSLANKKSSVTTVILPEVKSEELAKSIEKDMSSNLNPSERLARASAGNPTLYDHAVLNAENAIDSMKKDGE